MGATVLRRLRRRAFRLATGLTPRAVILLYHRIAEPMTDPHSLCVSADHFAQQLKVLRRQYHVVSLQDLRRCLETGCLGRRSVVLTFDDGYVDNLTNARPLLDQYELPATFFIPTGFLGRTRMFWWDELALLAFHSPLPDCLVVTDHEGEHRWDVGPASLERRQQLHDELYWLLQALDEEAREAALMQLRAQLLATEVADPGSRCMGEAELRELSRGELLEVGAHSVTHPVLSELTPEAQQREIQESQRVLQEILGRPVTSFSYPYGGEHQVGPLAPQLARDSGFRVACSGVPQPVFRRADPYLLPRFVVKDWNGDEFAAELRRFFAWPWAEAAHSG
jgi:peptidoglycan/xylan/chitin deacetylase (PgdA/CDA1 family)